MSKTKETIHVHNNFITWVLLICFLLLFAPVLGTKVFSTKIVTIDGAYQENKVNE